MTEEGFLDFSRHVGLDDERLRADFLNNSRMNTIGTTRTYCFLSCHGNLPASSPFQIDPRRGAPTIHDLDNIAASCMNQFIPMRIIRYLRDSTEQYTYQISYSVRERFPHDDRLYDRYGAEWTMNEVLDVLHLNYQVPSLIWQQDDFIESETRCNHIVHHVVAQLLNIALLTLNSTGDVKMDEEDDAGLLAAMNLSKAILAPIVLTRSFLQLYIHRLLMENRSASLHLCKGTGQDKENLQITLHEGKLNPVGQPPREWQVLADFVPDVFLSSGTTLVPEMFIQAMSAGIHLIDAHEKFEFTDLQDMHDAIVLSSSAALRRLVADDARIRSITDDLDDFVLPPDMTVCDDWRDAEEHHLASEDRWSSISSPRRIGGVKVRPENDCGMMIKEKGPDVFKLLNKDKSLAMKVGFDENGLNVMRRGTIKDIVKRVVPFTEFRSPLFGATFKDNFVAVKNGDIVGLTNAILSGCYGSRAAVWLLGKMLFSGMPADEESPSVIAARRPGGVAIRSMIGSNVARNLLFLTDGHKVYMYYPGVYALKELVNMRGYYACRDTNIRDTSGMKKCKLDSIKQIA